ncbi:MAG: hypothetical protein KKG43_04175 [Candidatus Omnitrophica bacterium]|nr:hypothetical protein [Candidatus Omnitrophota bacterium]MBU1928703.1 hypothetical protein [Candidatus Omnitrophota bacterium]MBU2221030.1 hypothetical protein [Candidatus Omnitrophota bacterium]
MKKYGLILALVFLVLGFVPGVLAQESEWEDVSRGESDFRAVLFHPYKQNIIYAGTGKSVLKSEDKGNSWREVLSISGRDKKVNYLLFSPKDINCIYAATGAGLFYSTNAGGRWSRIYKGKDYLENDCTCLAVLPYGIYLGTRAGLIFSKDKGRSWQKVPGKPGQSQIYAIACSLKEPDYIYTACAAGIFKTKDAGKYWEMVFQGKSTDRDGPDQEEPEDEEEEECFSGVSYMSIDPVNLNLVYLAVQGRVYRSPDKGQTWEAFSSTGLLGRRVYFILTADNTLVYAVTESGIFKYYQERWIEVSLRLIPQKINFLAAGSQNYLYAAAEKGLFRSRIIENRADNQDNITSLYFKGEPGIDEVQQAAIKYAEVEIEKIKEWRKKAARKAWLPKISAGMNRDVSDLYHWEGGSTTKAEDDILRKGRDSLDWDISFSWDLGELIWNQDQTSIDVRSKLMVQLRDDVLNEITKLYFERIRVKMELDNVSIEDRKKRFEKELRLQELTAMINGLTGGFFLQKANN